MTFARCFPVSPQLLQFNGLRPMSQLNIKTQPYYIYITNANHPQPHYRVFLLQDHIIQMETSNRPFLPPYLVEERLDQQQPRRVVTVAQPADPSSPLEVPPQTWLPLSIFNCVCCCWIFGIIAIVLSSQSRNASLNGEIANLETNDQV